MTFKSLTVLDVPEELQSANGWVVRVFAEIENPPVYGLPMTAEVGGQQLEAFGVTESIEPMLSGYLKTLPNVGDELVIKIGTETIPTGLTVEDPPIA